MKEKDYFDLKEEEIKRDLCKASFRDFSERLFTVAEGGKYVEGTHIDILCKKLEQVALYIESGGKHGIGQLIIQEPPRHSKSSHTSILFPSWFLGRNPEKKVIVASCAASLSEKHSRKARNVVASPEYSKIFGEESNLKRKVKIDQNESKVEEWAIEKYRGLFKAVGVGGQLTGSGGDLIIVDDPHKDREEADSKTMRDKVWDWWTSTLLTRKQPGAAVIVMCTRWHEDDLIGRLLSKERDDWDVLDLPAVALQGDMLGRQEGDALWPQMFDTLELEKIKKSVGRRDWNSLYQQRPTGETGEVFNSEWFVYGNFPDKSEIIKGFQVWDTAFTEKTENDPSVCGTFYITRDHRLFTADVQRYRLPFPLLKQQMVRQWKRFNEIFPVTRVFIESQGSGISLLQSLKIESGVPVLEAEKDKKYGRSKLAQASAASDAFQEGRVVFHRNAPWLKDVETELLSFPRGKHDDIVDVITYAILNHTGLLKHREQASNEIPKDFAGKKDRFTEVMGGGWNW